MTESANGARRPIQFWAAILGIGGTALTTILLILAVTTLAIYGTEGRAESDTLNNALLLSLGGLVGLSGSVGAFLFSRGAQGEPLPTVYAPPPVAPGTTVTTSIRADDAAAPGSAGG